MIKKIKLTLLSLSSLFAFSAPLLIAAPAHAVFTQDDINRSACSGSEGVFQGQRQCDKTEADLNSIARKIINIISVIIGFVAVIMIIYGGFRYITSGGDSGRVGDAKNTILYGIIGLVIVALAQVIVQFVLRGTSDAVD
jgi:hypothetical protein